MKKLLFLLLIVLLISNIFQVIRYQSQSIKIDSSLETTLHKWLLDQRVNLRSISNLVSKTLIINDNKSRENHLINLDESIDVAIRNMWSDALLTELTSWFERTNYQHMLR